MKIGDLVCVVGMPNQYVEHMCLPCELGEVVSVSDSIDVTHNISGVCPEFDFLYTLYYRPNHLVKIGTL